jgi:hypothetical protein
VTEPTGPSSIDVNLLSAPVQYMHTPPSALFGDVRPSPAAFASTGLIKKKSGITVEIPKFGTASETAAMTKEPTSAISPTSPISPTTVMSGGHGHVGRFVPEKRTSTNSTTGAAGGAGAQKSRGLRRKGSTMFAATGSSGSVVEVCKVFTGSPATPTKPTIQCEWERRPDRASADLASDAIRSRHHHAVTPLADWYDLPVHLRHISRSLYPTVVRFEPFKRGYAG